MSSGSLDVLLWWTVQRLLLYLVVHVEINPRDHMDGIRVVASHGGPFFLFRQLWWDAEGN